MKFERTERITGDELLKEIVEKQEQILKEAKARKKKKIPEFVVPDMFSEQ